MYSFIRIHSSRFYQWQTLLTFASLIVSPFISETKYTVGVDLGTEGVRVGIFSSKDGKLKGSGAISYQTNFPRSGWAEQNPHDWYSTLCEACSTAVAKSGISLDEIASVAIDSTACSVIALDKHYDILRPCLLWMDARSALQTKVILDNGRKDKALKINSNGRGPLSAEWMIPKALWIKQEEPEIWGKAAYICEKQDYMNYKLTGRLCASGCNVAARWHWNAESAIKAKSSSELLQAQPVSLLEKIDLLDLLIKWPSECVAMGALVAPLSPAAASDLGLPPGIPVCQGGPDAYVGMVGLGCVAAGQLALITGSSHLHLSVGSEPSHAEGIWGAYEGALLPGLCFAEGGQSSTGSVLSWARRLFSGGNESHPISYKVLDEEASHIPVGADGLIALETFQGSRTPATDPFARGALLGLTLSHTRAHIWRALLEAICLGTRAALEALQAAGYTSAKNELLVAGGATRSEFWLQMHADVTGLTIVVGEFDNAPLLGSAVLAAVGAGLHGSVSEAVQAMVRPARRIEPRPEITAKYDKLYELYKTVSPTVSRLSHSLATSSWLSHHIFSTSNGRTQATTVTLSSGRVGYIVPSILAADLTNLLSEVSACASIGARWIHVDVCDGSELCQGQLTFGPAIVEALHCKDPDLLLDVHVATRHPRVLVDQLASAGAHRFTFQLESLSSLEEAVELARSVRRAGMLCGVCITPDTPVESLFDLLKLRWHQNEFHVPDKHDGDAEPLIDLVDILAVEPGIGGQKFNKSVLTKVSEIRRRFPQLPYLAVDGGVNRETAVDAAASGANVLVAGSSVFDFDRCGKSNYEIERMIKANLMCLADTLNDYGR